MAARVDYDAQLTALHERLTEQVRQLRTGDDWARWLAVAARFPTYSVNNTMLILAQNPDASQVAGYRAWQAMGRQVGKGQKGLQILAPLLRRPASPDTEVSKSRDDEPQRPRVRGYRVTHVWDVSQTSGQPMPQRPTAQLLHGRAPDGLWDALAVRVAAEGFALQRGPCRAGANGITDFDLQTVRVRDDVDDAQAVKTLAHELGHVLLHAAGTDGSRPDCRGVVEVEAESVAFLVTASHGLASDSYTFPYVTSWAATVGDAKPEDVVRQVGIRVTDAARRVLQGTQDSPDVPTEALADVGARTRAGVAETSALPAEAEVTAQRLTKPSGRRIPAVSCEQLLAVHADAAEFFGRDLGSSWVPGYLAERGLATALAEESGWQFGYAPRGWTTLIGHLRGTGYSDETLEASGLAVRASTGGLVDRFRDRLVLPVRDAHGDVIAFVGRAHPATSDRTPKYLNSPTTSIYRKGEHLLAPHSTARAGALTPVLVEGPLDAVAVSLASPARHLPLALCGTALTEQQSAVVARAAGGPGMPVVVATDSDAAGLGSACAAYRHLCRVGLEPWMADLPPGVDPAALMATNAGSLRLRVGLLDGARPLADSVVDARVAEWSDRLRWVEGRVGVVRALAPDLALLGPLQVTRQVDRLAEIAGVDVHTVRREITHARNPAASGKFLRAPRPRRMSLTGTDPPSTALRPRDVAHRSLAR